MSLSLGENLSPLPVSTSTRCPAVSTSRHCVVYSTRFRSSHDTSFDQIVFGTTPCMAPPSRRKFPPLSMVSLQIAERQHLCARILAGWRLAPILSRTTSAVTMPRWDSRGQRGYWCAVGINCGSSGGPSGTLDCAWGAGDNCWKTTASAAQSCLPSPSETGTFSADRSTCTYATGPVVTFTPPLTLPVPTSGATWNFTVANGATPCLSLPRGHRQGHDFDGDGPDVHRIPIGARTQREMPRWNELQQLECVDPLELSGKQLWGTSRDRVVWNQHQASAWA